MIYAVVFLKHEETLITFESALDTLYAVSHLSLDVSLFGLKFIGTFVEREDQKIDRDAQENDRQTFVADYPVCNRKDNFKKKLKRCEY